MALARKAKITPLRQRWVVKSKAALSCTHRANIVDREYTIERDGDRVAEISKR